MTNESLLLQLPGAGVAFISVWLATWWAGKYNGRAIAIVALIIPTLIGGALMAWLPADDKRWPSDWELDDEYRWLQYAHCPWRT